MDRRDDEGEYLEDDEDDVEDSWVDGLRRYRFRRRLWLFSDPRGVLGRGTGTGMWSAGEVLSDYFAEHQDLCRGAKCLELGAGIGGVGLTVAACGAELVVLTDQQAQMPLLRRNAQENFPTSETVHVRVLDWRRAEQRTGLHPWNRTWSLIIGSDIGYDPDLFTPLLETLMSQCSQDTVVYFALAHRQEDDEPDADDFKEAAKDLFTCEDVFARRLEPHQSETKVLRLRRRSRRRRPSPHDRS